MGIQIIKPTEIFFFKDELECLEYYADYDSDEDVMGWKPYHHTAIEHELWQSGYLDRARESFQDTEYDAPARITHYKGLHYLECLRHERTKAELSALREVSQQVIDEFHINQLGPGFINTYDVQGIYHSEHDKRGYDILHKFLSLVAKYKHKTA